MDFPLRGRGRGEGGHTARTQTHSTHSSMSSGDDHPLGETEVVTERYGARVSFSGELLRTPEAWGPEDIEKWRREKEAEKKRRRGLMERGLGEGGEGRLDEAGSLLAGVTEEWASCSTCAEASAPPPRSRPDGRIVFRLRVPGLGISSCLRHPYLPLRGQVEWAIRRAVAVAVVRSIEQDFWRPVAFERRLKEEIFLFRGGVALSKDITQILLMGRGGE